MKTTKITLTMAVVLTATSLLFTDCRKKTTKTEEPPDTDQTTANDNSLAENTSNDIVAMGSQVSENSGTLTTYRLIGNNNANTGIISMSGEEMGLAAACATVSFAGGGGTVVPTSYTIDFGTTGCVGADQRTRKGKLIYDFTQSTNGAKYYRNPGFKMIVTSNGYMVDGNAVNITNKTVTNITPTTIPTGTNPGTNIKWNINSNISITKANNAGSLTWTCNRDKELINTNDANVYHGQLAAITWSLAKIQLNGTASGTNANNESYSAVATNLVRDFTCAPDNTKPHRHPFVSGTIDYTPGNKPTRHIDYGSGCDFNATITINGQTWAVTLP